MKILIHMRAFPISMGRWFQFALKDLGHQVIVAGPSLGDEVPWPNGPHHFPQYNFRPDILLPDVPEYPLTKLIYKYYVEYDRPQVVIQASDAGFLGGRVPRGIKNVVLATDPHCIDYHPRLENADFFFCMQRYYMNKDYSDFPKRAWIPYAYYPPVHKKLTLEKKYDVVFCGLPYKERLDYLQRVKEEGVRIFSGLGLLYEEYNQVYNEGIIAFNHSSLLDVPARFWEGLAMGNLVLTNHVPELDVIGEKMGLLPGVHYVVYNNIDEAVELTKYYLSHPMEAANISIAGHKKVAEETYYKRVEELLLWTLS